MGVEFHLQKRKRVLEMDDGNGCTLGMHSVLLQNGYVRCVLAQNTASP